MLCRGLVLIEQGRQEEGMRQIRQGLAAHRATGAEAGQPYALAFLARAYGQDGQGDTGQQVLDEALALVHHTGERCYEAELYRLKGELLLQGGTRPKAHGTEQQCGGSRAEFSSGPRRRPPPAGEVPGAAGGDESGSVVATAGQARRSPRGYSPQSTAGSARGLIPLTCKRPGRC